MNSVWKALLWKEWREHRWKLAALAAIVVVTPTLMSLHASENYLSGMVSTLLFAVPLGSMFIGMHAAAGENSQGTMRFLQALPVPLAKPAAAKLLCAAVAVVAPALVAVIVAAVWNVSGQWSSADSVMVWQLGSVWGIHDRYLAIAMAGAAGGLSIFLWMAAAGVNRSDEVRAAALGLLSMLVCWAAFEMAVVSSSQVEHGVWTPPRWYEAVMAAAPGGPALGRPLQPYVEPIAPRGWTTTYFAPLAVALTAHGALAAWYIGRFGRIAPRREPVVDPTRIVTAARAAYLRPPRRSRLGALVWKQTRESAPLALLGSGVIALAAVASATVRNAEFAGDLAYEIIILWLLVGAFVAVVAGVGAFMDDLRPGLHTFWRSRPIHVNQWFAVKSVLTMILTVAILAIPPVLLVAFCRDWLGNEREDLIRTMLPMGLMFQAGLFAAAAAVMTLVRQAIYSAILAIALAVAYLFAVIWIIERTVPQWDPHTYPVFTAFLFATPTAAALFVAWLAVRKNWGWKG